MAALCAHSLSSPCLVPAILHSPVPTVSTYFSFLEIHPGSLGTLATLAVVAACRSHMQNTCECWNRPHVGWTGVPNDLGASHPIFGA